MELAFGPNFGFGLLDSGFVTGVSVEARFARILYGQAKYTFGGFVDYTNSLRLAVGIRPLMGPPTNVFPFVPLLGVSQDASIRGHGDIQYYHFDERLYNRLYSDTRLNVGCEYLFPALGVRLQWDIPLYLGLPSDGSHYFPHVTGGGRSLNFSVSLFQILEQLKEWESTQNVGPTG
jgi:hypothetical protein